MLARGLSVRDIEDPFKDETGRLLLSRTAASEIGKQLWEAYQGFKSRDLAEYDIAYLFGMHLAEVLGLEWERVRHDHIFIPAELNNSQRDFWLPITDAHLGILEPMRGLDDRWRFPGSKARDGHVVALTGVPPWTLHSLRHRFASIGVEIGYLEESVG